MEVAPLVKELVVAAKVPAGNGDGRPAPKPAWVVVLNAVVAGTTRPSISAATEPPMVTPAKPMLMPPETCCMSGRSIVKTFCAAPFVTAMAVGSIAVIGGFGLIVWFGVQAALAAPDRFGMLLAGGVACWLGVQAIVNIGGVAGVIPVTGLTLPFFSAGGTSLCVSMVAAGLLLNVARRAITAPRARRSAKSAARTHRSTRSTRPPARA